MFRLRFTEETTMKSLVIVLAISFSLLTMGMHGNFVYAAAAVKTYQVTGPVLEVTDTMIAVQKGKDRWELARDPSTKVNGDLKVGANVTIIYRMIATTIDVKPAKAVTAKTPEKPKKP
jgi:hypothetical protein